MELVNLYVPLVMPDHVGFHDKGVPLQTLFGYPIRLEVLEGLKHFYAIEFQGVPRVEVDAILQRFRALLPWASMRLDCSMQTSQEALEQKDATSPGLTGGSAILFNATAPTVYPFSLRPRPMFGEARTHHQQPITKLVEFLQEAEATTTLATPDQARLDEAFALFATADFEASDTAKFVVLTTILEILAAPPQRPDVCQRLIDGWLRDGTKARDDQQDESLKHALTHLLDSARNLKRDSFRGSIRRLVANAVAQLGKPSPENEGAVAAKLYDDRSKLVHDGIPMSRDRLAELRRLVRYVLEACARRELSEPDST